VRAADHLDLVVEPELSIVTFRRSGWAADEYRAWSDERLSAQESFIVPTSWGGTPALRICIVNPLTTAADIEAVVESLR
jgi:hypothetical protein